MVATSPTRMLFHSSLRRELAHTFSATLSVLLIIVMTMMLIKTLNLASRGAINPAEVLLVLGYTVLAYLPTLLTLSLFVSMVYVLSRMYRDSEMAVWFASGQGLMHFLPPLLRFALPVLLVVAGLALLAWPWANAQVQDLRQRHETRGDLERLAAGHFQESSDGQRVFYIGAATSLDSPPQIAPSTLPASATTSATPASPPSSALLPPAMQDMPRAARLFVFARQPHSDVVLSAASGQLHLVDGSRFIRLFKGHSTELHDDHQLTLVTFGEYGLRLDAHALPPSITQGQDDADAATLDALPSRVIDTSALVRHADPRLLGELSWRLGMALSVLNFTLLALAAARINPRSGRGGGVVVALLCFVLYYNLINFGQSWISQGKVGFTPLLLALHGGIALLCLIWLWLRQQQWTLRTSLAQWRVRMGRSGGHA